MEKIQLPLTPNREHLRLFFCAKCETMLEYVPEKLNNCDTYEGFKRLNCINCDAQYSLGERMFAKTIEEAYLNCISFLSNLDNIRRKELDMLSQAQKSVLDKAQKWKKALPKAHSILFITEKFFYDILRFIDEDKEGEPTLNKIKFECEDALKYIDKLKSGKKEEDNGKMERRFRDNLDTLLDSAEGIDETQE